MPLAWMFLLLPIIEIALFVVIGGEIGVSATLLWVILSAVIGIALLRHEGREAALDIQQSLQQMRDPARPIGDRTLKMLGSFLLILPGFLTDFLGILLLIPPLRHLLMRQVAARSHTKVNFGFTRPPYGARPDEEIIDGEYEIHDDPYATPPGKALPRSSQDGKAGGSGWTRH